MDKNKQVIEIASNDGYLLRNFVKQKIPCLGIEPAKDAAKESEKFGIKVIKKFFSYNLARRLSKKKADLICANNVYAHVPDINDFTKGLKYPLKKKIRALEFPHLLKLINELKFDTIYHEHYSYLSLIVVNNI